MTRPWHRSSRRATALAAPAAAVDQPPGADRTAAPAAPLDPAALADPARFDPAVASDPRLAPPPPAETVWPRVVIVTGIALVVAGITGMVASPGCATRDGADRCLDAQGSDPVWPALVVIGLGATVTGNYWDRWTRLDVPPAQPVTP
ncbi:MAG: hypothetical protein H6705_09250 [Myxococcales bacterium]|nr:hypothetical protein [Myxococcales bacterium]